MQMVEAAVEGGDYVSSEKPSVPGGENIVYTRSSIGPLCPVIEPEHNRESKHEEEALRKEDTEGCSPGFAWVSVTPPKVNQNHTKMDRNCTHPDDSLALCHFHRATVWWRSDAGVWKEGE